MSMLSLQVPRIAVESLCTRDWRSVAKRTFSLVLLLTAVANAQAIITTEPMPQRQRSVRDRRATTHTRMDSATFRIVTMNVDRLAPHYQIGDPIGDMLLGGEYAQLLQAEHQGWHVTLTDSAAVRFAGWKRRREIARTFAAIHWAPGPLEVTMDSALKPWKIPAGLLVMTADEIARVKASLAALGSEFPAADLVIAPIDTSWLATVSIIVAPFVRMTSVSTLDADRMLSTLNRRRSAISNLRYDASAVAMEMLDSIHWVVPPQFDSVHRVFAFAHTERRRSVLEQAPGPTLTHYVQGRRELVMLKAIVSNDSVARAADRMLRDAESGLEFSQGNRASDVVPADAISPASMVDLIAGPPSAMEKGVQRIMKEQERKGNFFYFLSDNPRYAAMLVAALAGLWRIRVTRSQRETSKDA